jgi:hypothetical protein
MSSLVNALERIVNWLQQNYPEAASSLQPGLSCQAIKAQVAGLPFSLPKKVYELYQWRNGMDREDIDFFYYFRFIPLDEALEIIKFFEESEDTLGSHIPFCWFPLFEFEGEYIGAIGTELVTEDSPLVYVDPDEGDEYVAYTNLTSMMQTIAECYETGTYYMDYEVVDYYMDTEKRLQQDSKKAQKIHIKYNPEIPHYVYKRQKTKRNDDFTIVTFHNPREEFTEQVVKEDERGAIEEHSYYLGEKIIRRITYKNQIAGFNTYISKERWYAGHELYEEFQIVADLKSKPRVKRHYFNGVLKKEIICLN